MNRARQRGAIGLSATLLMLSVVLLAAVSIDSARLLLAQRTLQAQADLAALAMSRSTCYIDGVNNEATLRQQVQASLQANGFTGTPTISFGNARIADSHWQYSSGGSEQSAGRVTLSESVPASLLAGGIFTDEIQLSASATVLKRLNVGYSMGSGLVNVDLTNSLFSALLGGSVSLLSYDGLLNAQISLGELLAALDETGTGFNTDLTLGNLTELLETEVSVGDLLDAMIEVLGNDSTASSAVSLLQQLRLTGNSDALDVVLDSVLGLVNDSGVGEDTLARSLLATHLNVYNLLTASLMAANQSHAVTLSGLDVDLGITGLAVSMTVIEPPQYQVGYYPAADDSSVPVLRTAQLSLNAQATLLPGGTNLLGVLQVNQSTLSMTATVAAAEAKLLDASGCSVDDGVSLVFSVKPSLATLTIAPLSLTAVLQVTPLVTVPVTIAVTANVPAGNSSAVEETIALQNQSLPYRVRVATNAGTALSDTVANTTLTLNVSGATLSSSLLTALTSSLLTPIKTIGTTVLDPLLQSLGVTAGYVDLTVESLKTDKGNLIQ
ncbi:hypothetical protein QCD60_10700 [Pokkaliibacter sp. MBI-7]|uniref:hypothetical protein n=1 Tax=Pokkaliibacter sp. MBI-7 TaxID=3040600 RepID=UPI00244C5CF3|nr:hypothetical protein [Pokkaliibacter sp. MBI-7]MDH2433037.1 hypothetical protein [Pokkaliibacter sp. MBI-7]